MRKKAQEAIGVSIFIMLLILFIIIYVILLPPAEREELLEPFEEAGEEEFAVSGKVLLSESPGELYTYTTNIQKNNLAPMHLSVKEETTTEAVIKSLSISRNILKDNYRNIKFDVNDLENVKSLQLLFLITESEGDLTIRLNKHLIFEGVLTTEQLPLNLPTDFLKEKENNLLVSVSSPGKNIFSTNYYMLEDVALIKKSTVENRKAERTFYIDSEFKVKKSTMNYFINCNILDVSGTLKIKLNDRLVLEDRIFCEYLTEREINLDKTYLRESGRNKISFEIDVGDYNIEHATIKTELAKATFPKYTFDIDSETYEDIREGDKDIKVYFSFPDTTTRKKASITVQESAFMFDTTSKSYSKKINNYVDDGINYIKIIPKTNFEMGSLKVTVK